VCLHWILRLASRLAPKSTRWWSEAVPVAEKSPATHTFDMHVFAEWLSPQKLSDSSMVSLPDLITAQGDSTPRLLRYVIQKASWRNVRDWRHGRIPWRPPDTFMTRCPVLVRFDH
jgi:hypothetical protein